MNSDDIAKKYLCKLGWFPKRITQGRNHKQNKGLPDFQCSNDRYVEVKKITPSKWGMLQSISKTQLKRWKQLSQEGKLIFLMVLSSDCNEYDLFEIKYWKVN